MSNLTPIQKRAARKNRNQTMVDMNLVSLIDVFTILIFFLLSSASGVELISSPKAVELPMSTTDTSPKQTVVVTVTDADILVEGKLVASVAQVLATEGDVIAPLKAELEGMAKREALLESNKATAKAMTIMGDKDIPYRLMRRVMVSGAQAGFTDVSFAVRRKDGL